MLSILDGLNPVQRDAVRATEGPVLVLAGPGSGKTRVLTHRIAYLIHQTGLRPYNILAVTFTNKAAREMTARLEGLIGDDVRQLMIGTFHAICARILRREGHHVGVQNNFVIYDADDQRRVITRVLKELNVDSKQYQPSGVHAAISRAKNDLQTAETYRPPTYWHEVVARAFARYDEILADSNALDFDDLLVKAEMLFRLHDEVRERYQQRYSHILVDEFQDTNRAQYDLVGHLAAARRNIFVVGDEDQSIYSWRGADFRNVLRFREDYPQAQVFLLEQNYRSTQNILEAAHAVISRNTQRTEKKLWTENATGAPISFYEAYDEREEADYVAANIDRLVTRGHCRYADCAVMFRTNAQSRSLEDAFLRARIPYRLVGAVRFFQRREVKDILAYLRVVYNPDDDESLRRIINVPTRGIGDMTLEQLSRWAQAQGLSMGRALLHMSEVAQSAEREAELPFRGRARNALLEVADLFSALAEKRAELRLSELLTMIVERSGYADYLQDHTEEGEERVENVRELVAAAARYDALAPETALPTFLEEVALFADVDELPENNDVVTLLTLHTAKGLEFDSVFIVGMEEGICPHSRSSGEPDAMEEERRLCYVGLTRAKRNLHLVRTVHRTVYGSSAVREPSRYLFDIPSSLVEGSKVQRGARSEASADARAPFGPSAGRPAASGRTLVDQRRARVQRAIARRRGVEASTPAPQPQRNVGRAVEETERAASRDLPSAARLREPAFRAGETVLHRVFGQGVVISCQVVDNDDEVNVAFEGRGIKRMLQSFAQLERVG
ncbi:MAG: UvrD-helicase domain-containing protein [Chloroflexi bacterium]|nr:UvrD-helicase domain-containing protein [Chloroflexota bacterium]